MTFSCKTCQEEIVYEPNPIPAMVENPRLTKKKKTIYLTCGNGHTHPYPVEVNDSA
jgi:hypothetical protein